jgi:hypothetical protein
VEENNEEKRATRNSCQNLKPMSDKKTRLILDCNFSETQFQKISRGLIPLGMEDKWFIFLEDNTLYFHRSWTGECIYQITFSKEQNKYVPKEVWVCRDFNKYKFITDKYDAELVLFLIENLLLENNVPFPLPLSLENIIPKGVFQHSVSGTGYKESITADE